MFTDRFYRREISSNATAESAPPSREVPSLNDWARNLIEAVRSRRSGGDGLALMGLRVLIFEVGFVTAACSVILLEVRNSHLAFIPVIVALPVYAIRRIASRSTNPFSLTPTLLDRAAIFVLLVEILSYYCSVYRPNSLDYLCQFVVSFGLYCLWIWGLDRDYQRVAVYLFITLLGFWMSSRALYSFYLYYRRLSSLGFHEITSFRHLFFLVGSDGYATGERVSVLLLMLPFPLILALRFRGRRWLACALLVPVITILAAMSVTFLRGIYAGAAAFAVVAGWIVWRHSIVSRRTIIRVGLVIAVLTGLALAPVWRSVVTTLSVATTESQVRSIEGRASLWSGVPRIFERHPLLGSGAYNFPIEYSHFPEDKPDFVIGAFNTFLQVLTEKGTLGLAAYLCLFIAFFSAGYRIIKDPESDIFRQAVAAFAIAAVAAALTRDLTYCSLLVNPASLALLWFLFADLRRMGHAARLLGDAELSDSRLGPAKPDPSVTLPFRTSWKTSPFALAVVTVIAMVAICWSAVAQREQGGAAQNFNSFVQFMNSRQYQQAEREIEKCVKEAPGNAYYRASLGLVHERIAESPRAELADLNGVTFSPPEASETNLAVEAFQTASRMNPYDDSFVHNLGWLYWFQGRRDQAIACFEKAIALDGSVPQYRVSLGLACETTGDGDRATSAYTAALRISPTLVSSRFFFDLRKRSPRLAEACVYNATRYLEQDFAHDPDPVIEAKLARFYMQENPQKAERLLSRASMKLPELSRVWSNLASIAQIKGDPRRAKTDYQRAVFLDSSDYVPLVGLARYYESEGDYRGAIDCYSLAMAKWQALLSGHAYRATRIYRSNVVPANDLVPRWLLHYTEPLFDWPGVCLRVSELYTRLGDGAHASEYSALSKNPPQ